jgi:hypothetical protein
MAKPTGTQRRRRIQSAFVISQHASRLVALHEDQLLM